jgi:hypothetical protein
MERDMRAQPGIAHRPVPGITDRFGTVHQTANRDAVSAFGDAVEAIAAHRPEAVALIDRALAGDPNLVAAHAVRGFGGVILARAETVAAARLAREAAHAAGRLRDSITADEAVLLEALDHAIGGRLLAAAAVLDRHLRKRPHALLLIKLSCSLRFMAGDSVGMRRMTTGVLSAWQPDDAGYGFVLGCHAFALEETDDLAVAERLGMEAVERESRDAWALHAVAHVHEMTGRTSDGIAWIERTRPLWKGCNNFSFHLAWHLALFRLEQGRHALVLDLYDREIRATRTEDFRDVANAASLLWRLRQEGVDVGDRWRELAEIAHRRRHDTTLVFASLHHLLALAATGDLGTAGAILLALQRAAASSGDQARAAAEAGVPLARVLLASAEPAYEAVSAALPLLGGSHAQRDLFMRVLLERAARDGEATMLRRLLNARGTRKRDDRFAARLRP